MVNRYAGAVFISLFIALGAAACGGVSSGDADGAPGGDGGLDAAGTDGGLEIDTCSTQILFEDGGHIWRINTNGSGLEQLTTEGDNRAAEWSPESLIAYFSVRGTAQNIIVMEADGSNSFVVSGNDTPATVPQWILGATRRVGYTIESGQDASLIAVTPAGAREVIRAVDMLAGTRIGWSENGTRYTFMGPAINQPSETAFWIGTVGDTGRSGFNNPTFGNSVWSPGDARILYEQSRDIFTVSSGAGTSTIANLTQLVGSLRARDPQWYSSNRILFTRDSTPSGPANLYVMNDDGTDQRALTTTDNAANARISPDKKQIVFEQGAEIAVMELNTDLTVGPVIPITTGSHPRWRPCAN